MVCRSMMMTLRAFLALPTCAMPSKNNAYNAPRTTFHCICSHCAHFGMAPNCIRIASRL